MRDGYGGGARLWHMFPAAPEPEKVLVARDLKVMYEPGDCVPDVIVYVTAGAIPESMSETLRSIENQELGPVCLGVVILLDRCLGPMSVPTIPDGLRDRTWILIASCGSPSRARNALLDFVDDWIPSCRWLARLDHDDVLFRGDSLYSMVAAGEQRSALVVLGGNRVLDRSGLWLRDNPSSERSIDRTELLELLKSMANGTARNELPSCNLVHRRAARLRYPDMASGEDHWVVAEWLILRPQKVVVVTDPFYCDYRIDGQSTVEARGSQSYIKARRALYNASLVWSSVLTTREAVLGVGQEGIVTAIDDIVRKRFYPEVLTSDTVTRLSHAMRRAKSVIPAGWFSEGDCGAAWNLTYQREETYPFNRVSAGAVLAFLRGCLAAGIVCANVKRSNFQVRPDGSLVYIDVGNWLVDMDGSVFADATMRTYSIAVCGNRDEEIMRRRLPKRGRTAVEVLPEWAEWYRAIMEKELGRATVSLAQGSGEPLRRDSDTTLLIKVCAMDARDLRAQLSHLLELLPYPSGFARTMVLLDSFRGPFLRAHSTGDYDAALATLRAAVECGEIDEILISPDDPMLIESTLVQWFGVRTAATHTELGVPVFPQVWAFDQIETRYVLQLDVDVLIGREDLSHDFLAEMKGAISAHDDVVCVAFCIPPVLEGQIKPYGAPEGEYKPEVRLGLLDLHRIRTLLPLPNTARNGRLVDGWYRALHDAQRRKQFRTLRGGDGRSYYLHPTNDLKRDREWIDRVRNCLASGWCQSCNRGHWDLLATEHDWTLPQRTEPIVVLARGRDTPESRIHRFLASLLMQDDQSYGVVVIDDYSESSRAGAFRALRIELGQRATILRFGQHGGRMQSVVQALRGVCSNPNSAIVFVDLDDALLAPNALRTIRARYESGHDAVWAGAHRPERPDHLEVPCFESPRKRWGGSVWTHLRSFRRGLFDRVPESYLKFRGQWTQCCEDVALMMCIAELADSPCWVPEMLYLHERTTVHEAEELRLREQVMMHFLTLEPLADR